VYLTEGLVVVLGADEAGLLEEGEVLEDGLDVFHEVVQLLLLRPLQAGLEQLHERHRVQRARHRDRAQDRQAHLLGLGVALDVLLLFLDLLLEARRERELDLAVVRLRDVARRRAQVLQHQPQRIVRAGDRVDLPRRP
jgi:hypothetical protein